MRSSQSRRAGSPRTAKPRIVCDPATWSAGVRELATRTNGSVRESGAFLLGDEQGATKRIRDFVFYDDIDPHALDSGIVHFEGSRLPKLWELCRERGYGVVADVHVHPWGYGQSTSDQADPVIPRVGHIAFIIPHFAHAGTEPGDIGLYEFRGGTRWLDHSKAGARFFALTAQA